MKSYSLSPENFATLQKVDLTELDSHIRLHEARSVVEVDSLRDLLILLNEEICLKGMTHDQQEVNDYGRALYALYDELLALRAMAEVSTFKDVYYNNE